MTQCLDYGRSFICITASFNAVRFWIESRTVLHDDRDGGQVTFLQCGSCKSENTFAESDLFMSPNYDFMPIFGGDRLLIFRRHAVACIAKTPRFIEAVPIVSGLGLTEPSFFNDGLPDIIYCSGKLSCRSCKFFLRI